MAASRLKELLGVNEMTDVVKDVQSEIFAVINRDPDFNRAVLERLAWYYAHHFHPDFNRQFRKLMRDTSRKGQNKARYLMSGLKRICNDLEIREIFENEKPRPN